MTRSCALAGMIVAVTLIPPAIAEETSFGHIVALNTGSSFDDKLLAIRLVEADDTLSVTLDVAFVNSTVPGQSLSIDGRKVQGAPCKNTLGMGSYALDPKDTGVKLNELVLLSAYLAGKRVRLTLNGCVFDKPRIISVGLNAADN